MRDSFDNSSRNLCKYIYIYIYIPIGGHASNSIAPWLVSYNDICTTSKAFTKGLCYYYTNIQVTANAIAYMYTV